MKYRIIIEPTHRDNKDTAGRAEELAALARLDQRTQETTCYPARTGRGTRTGQIYSIEIVARNESELTQAHADILAAILGPAPAELTPEEQRELWLDVIRNAPQE